MTKHNRVFSCTAWHTMACLRNSLLKRPIPGALTLKPAKQPSSYRAEGEVAAESPKIRVLIFDSSRQDIRTCFLVLSPEGGREIRRRRSWLHLAWAASACCSASTPWCAKLCVKAAWLCFFMCGHPYTRRAIGRAEVGTAASVDEVSDLLR